MLIFTFSLYPFYPLSSFWAMERKIFPKNVYVPFLISKEAIWVMLQSSDNSSDYKSKIAFFVVFFLGKNSFDFKKKRA